MIKFIARTARLTAQIPRFCNSFTPNEALEQKINALEQNQPYFDRLIFFDPDMMASLPGFLQVFDPVVDFGRDVLMGIHSWDVPWVGVLGLTCLFARSSLLPLIYLQMKRTTRLATVIPAISQMKKLIDKSDESKMRRLVQMGLVTYDIVHSQKLKWMRLFLYNVFHVPMLVTLIWSIRRLLIDESFKQTSFLWIPSLSAMDPYYIVPIMTVACYYYNLQRFITKENKDSLPSRLRSFGQFLLILWLPFLCNWPSAISLYMFFNAIISVAQTTIMIHPEFQKLVDPKIFLYQMIVRMIEHDKSSSESIIKAIQTGEESVQQQAIQEEVLVQQFKKSLIELNEETNNEQKAQMDVNKPNFL